MRWRSLLFVGLLAGIVAVIIGVRALAQLPIPEARGADATTVVLDRRGIPIAHLHAEQHRLPLTLEEVSPVFLDAVVASEDRDFFRHPGVDPVAIARAAWHDIRREGELQGGSTITQQYVKNAFLEADRTLLRKLREAVLAIKIEREVSKPDILERYLNVIYLGRGAYGVEAASQVWFGVSAAELDVAQSAYLAALIRAPELADVARPEQVALAYQRRRSVLDAMLAEGYITAAEHERAEATAIESYTLPRGQNRSATMLVDDAGLDWFVDMVRRELIDRYGAERVFSGGLEVTTTIDVEAQRAAFAASQSWVAGDGSPDAAVVVLDDQGHIRVMVGGSDFDTLQVNLATGVAGGGGGRQPGSAFKPVVLAAAMAQGIELDAVYPSPAEMVVVGADAGADWIVRNPGGTDHGDISLAEATVISANTPFARLADELDLAQVGAVADQMGVTAELEPLFSVVLGAQELSVLDLASAYSVFASGGRLHEPLSVIAVTDPGGLNDRFVADSHAVLESETASDITSVLVEAVARGTGAAAAVPGVSIAGKTGTSQEHRDAWFVGYSPRFTTAVWMGHAVDGRPMTDVLGLPAVTGGSIPAQLFSEINAVLHRGLDPGAFDLPASPISDDGSRESAG